MFDNLSDKLQRVFKNLRGEGKLTAANEVFTVTRADKQTFAGDELRTRHQDGSESVQPPVLPVHDFETAALLTTPWAATFLPGERIELAAVCVHTVALTLYLHVQLRGYTYPTEITR